MNEYTLTTEITISLSTKVRARSLKEAIANAQERGVQGLCHQCSTGTPDTSWSTSGELDGDPQSGPLVSVLVGGKKLPPKQLEKASAMWKGQ